MFGLSTSAVPPLVFWIDASVLPIASVRDLSGYNNLLTTAVSAPSVATGQFNRGVKAGISFANAGTNQINLGSKVILNNGYSAFVTFNCATVSSGVANALDVPFTIIGDKTGTAGGANFGLDGNNVSYAYNSTKVSGTGGSLANGVNATIAVSHNINGNFRLFVNGALNATGTSSAFSRTITGFNAICACSAADNFNNGNIAEVLVWNGAIDDSLVQAYHERALQLWI